MSNFVFATCHGAKGDKLIMFRTYSDMYVAKDKWPHAGVSHVSDATRFHAADVARALNNLMRGEDGLIYCRKHFGEAK